jgi:hypothetical protein
MAVHEQQASVQPSQPDQPKAANRPASEEDIADQIINMDLSH